MDRIGLVMPRGADRIDVAPTLNGSSNQLNKQPRGVTRKVQGRFGRVGQSGFSVVAFDDSEPSFLDSPSINIRRSSGDAPSWEDRPR